MDAVTVSISFFYNFLLPFIIEQKINTSFNDTYFVYTILTKFRQRAAIFETKHTNILYYYVVFGDKIVISKKTAF